VVGRPNRTVGPFACSDYPIVFKTTFERRQQNYSIRRRFPLFYHLQFGATVGLGNHRFGRLRISAHRTRAVVEYRADRPCEFSPRARRVEYYYYVHADVQSSLRKPLVYVRFVDSWPDLVRYVFGIAVWFWSARESASRQRRVTSVTVVSAIDPFRPLDDRSRRLKLTWNAREFSARRTSDDPATPKAALRYVRGT